MLILNADSSILQLARILDLQFSEVAVHVTIDRGLDLANDGSTEQSKPLAEEPVLGSVLSYRLRSFTISNQPGQTYGVLSTAISLQGLSIDVTHPKANGKAGELWFLCSVLQIHADMATSSTYPVWSIRGAQDSGNCLLAYGKMEFYASL